MTITTNRGKTFDAIWAWGPVGTKKLLLAEVRDARKISQIAEDFEGCAEITCTQENVGTVIYSGYTRLVRVERMDDGNVEVALKLEEADVSDQSDH